MADLFFPQTRRFLDRVKKLALGHSQPDTEAHQHLADRTRDGADMDHYQILLNRAVAAISGKAEEKGVESLFHRGRATMISEGHRGLDDCEVVAFDINAFYDRLGFPETSLLDKRIQKANGDRARGADCRRQRSTRPSTTRCPCAICRRSISTLSTAAWCGPCWPDPARG